MERKRPNHILRRERELKGWSQQMLAEKLGTNEQSVNRWENGVHKPNRYFQTRLCLLFEKNAKELGFITQDMEKEGSSFQNSHLEKHEQLVSEDTDIEDLEDHLSPLAELFSKEDIMKFSNSRRQLLQNLITSVIIANNTLNISSIKGLETFLALITHDSDVQEEDLAKLETITASAWQLLKSDGLTTVEYLLSTYLPRIATFADKSTKYQERAASITSQGYILAGLVAILNMQLRESVRYCQKAIFYAKLAKDRNLEIAALKHLATKYTDTNYPSQALQTYQEALTFVDEISPLLSSRTYLGLALTYAQLNQKNNAIYYLELARETFPLMPENDLSFSYADCGTSSLYHYAGLISIEFDEYEKARDLFQQVREHPSRSIFPERTRLEIINCQTQASLALKDLQTTCELTETSIEGAKRLKSEKRFNEALSLYQQMRILWSHEKRLKTWPIFFYDRRTCYH